MGNKQTMHRANDSSAAVDSSMDRSQRQNRSSLSIFNCMAISQTCCNNDEVQTQFTSEVDQTQINRSGIQELPLKNASHFIHEKLDGKASSDLSEIHCVTIGTENIADNESIGPRMTSQTKMTNKIQRFFSHDPSTKNSVRVNAEINLTKGHCFNNRNERIMSSQRDLPYQNYQDKSRYASITDALKVTEAQRQIRSNKDLKVGLQLSGRHYYDTPSEGASRADRPSITPAKVCLTEVCQSQGDQSPPDIGNREFSPSVPVVPEDLRNLQNDDDLEIKSQRSQRLYTTSPQKYNTKKQSKIRNVRKKQLFPELAKIKPVIKEQSRNMTEFKKSVILQQGISYTQNQAPVQRRNNLNFINMNSMRSTRTPGSIAASRSLILDDELPVEIKQFLDRAKGRHPTVTTQSGSIYVGEMMGQKQQGFGFCQYVDKSYFFGTYLASNRHGRGYYVQTDGTKYQGDWENDQMNGEGFCKNKNGTSYEGSWRNHKPHGKGRETFPDRSSYEGDFEDGKKNGLGKLNCPDGGVYKGQFLKNQINGHGIYTWPDGIMYEGQWVNNKKQGRGCLKWLDGSREYKGEFKDDERHGEGTYTWEFGNKSYRGFWRNGIKDGIGYVRDELDYIERKGLWFCGKLVKWMPKNEEDEGQDGESVVSQDIVDWEGHQSNFLQQSAQGIAPSAREERKSSKRSSIEQLHLEELIQNDRMTITKDKQRSQENLLDLVQRDGPRIQTDGPMSDPSRMLQLTKSKLSNDQDKSVAGKSHSTRREILNFRKATDEVKRLTVKRNKITKRIPTTSKGSDGPQSNLGQSQFVAQATRGMLTLDKRVALVSGKDLQEFNPPEIWDEMQKQYGQASNELPSPKFVNKEIVVDVDEESKVDGQSEDNENEYFKFHPDEHIDESQDSF